MKKIIITIIMGLILISMVSAYTIETSEDELRVEINNSGDVFPASSKLLFDSCNQGRCNIENWQYNDSITYEEYIQLRIDLRNQPREVREIIVETEYCTMTQYNELLARVTYLESLFNITDYTEEPNYICSETGEEAKCPFGITTLTGKNTRCYTEENQFWWDAKYCKDDWMLNTI